MVMMMMARLLTTTNKHAILEGVFFSKLCHA